MHRVNGKPAAELLSPSKIEHDHTISLKRMVKILVCSSDNLLSTKTDKEDNDVTIYEFEPQLKEPPPEAQQHFDAVLQMISQTHDETDD